MKVVLQTVLKYLRFLRGAFPRQLPQGMTQTNALIDRLMSTYTLPSTVRDDIAFVVSGTILRFNETTCYKPDWYFVWVIRSVAAKQLAGAMFSEIKTRQLEAANAAKKAQLESVSEATGGPALKAVPDVKQPV